MTKADLVEQVTDAIAQTSGPMISKKDCARVVDSFLDAIKDALKEQKTSKCVVSARSRSATERLEWRGIHVRELQWK